MAIVAERYVRALLTSSKNKEESVMFEKGLQDIACNGDPGTLQAP